VLRPVPLGTTLEVSTTVSGFRKVWARRRTDGRLPDGTLAFWAHTDWVIVDARGLPTRVPAEFPTVYGALPGPFVPGRVALPPTPPGAAGHASVVRPQDLDPLAHVNNAAYLDYLEEALLAAGPTAGGAVGALPRSIHLEYLAQAAPGAIVRGAVWADPPSAGPGGAAGGWAWRLADEAGADLARGRLELTGDPEESSGEEPVPAGSGR
jgi:acyl-CoA thioesterase FadM